MRSLYQLPSHYRLLFDQRSDDVEFYAGLCHQLREQLNRPVTVLEFGAGTGRISLPLARAGHTVTSVEIEPAMLEEFHAALQHEAHEIRERVTTVCDDARSIRLQRAFDLVVFPFNGLAHFPSRQDQSELFASVRAHLGEESLFVFDVWLPNPSLLAGSTAESPWMRDRLTGEPIRYSEKYSYDPFRQTLRTRCSVHTLDKGVQEMEIEQRQFFPAETWNMLETSGWMITWRTSRFVLPPRQGTQRTHADNIPHEIARGTGEMLTYICRAT